jgi:hypothetical protein
MLCVCGGGAPLFTTTRGAIINYKSGTGLQTHGNSHYCIHTFAFKTTHSASGQSSSKQWQYDICKNYLNMPIQRHSMTWDISQLLCHACFKSCIFHDQRKLPECRYHLTTGHVLCAFEPHSFLRDFDVLLSIGREIWNVINVGMTSCISIPITEEQINEDHNNIYIYVTGNI